MSNNLNKTRDLEEIKYNINANIVLRVLDEDKNDLEEFATIQAKNNKLDPTKLIKICRSLIN